MVNLYVVRRALFLGRMNLVALCLAVAVLSSSCADMVIKDVHHEQFTGPNLVMKTTVANRGSKQAPPSVTTLSANYSWSDPYTQYATVATPSLDPGQQLVLPIWIFPPTLLPAPGSCFHVKVCADAGNAVSEGWFGELNNCLTRSFSNRRFCPTCDLCCDETLPASFDWRDWKGKNWVTSVKNQRDCGSCWAFSAVGGVEATNNTQAAPDQISQLNLSEQNLVTCSGAGDCLGGWLNQALDFIKTQGIVAEATFPYQSQNCVHQDGDELHCNAACTGTLIGGCANPLTCVWTLPAPTWRVANYHRVDLSGSADPVVDTKRALLCHGPLSACSSNWSHCIVIVGWFDTRILGVNVHAWIIKNSWGTGWGGDGYGLVSFTGHVYSDLIYDAWYSEEVAQW